MGSKVRKYCEGSRFDDLHEVILAIKDGEYLWVRDKPTHPMWVEQWPLAMIEAAMKGGALRRARWTPEYIELMNKKGTDDE